jgi:hypothetical protein
MKRAALWIACSVVILIGMFECSSLLLRSYLISEAPHVVTGVPKGFSFQPPAGWARKTVHIRLLSVPVIGWSPPSGEGFISITRGIAPPRPLQATAIDPFKRETTISICRHHPALFVQLKPPLGRDVQDQVVSTWGNEILTAWYAYRLGAKADLAAEAALRTLCPASNKFQH